METSDHTGTDSQVVTEFLDLVVLSGGVASFADAPVPDAKVSISLSQERWIELGRPSGLRVTAEVFRA